MRAVAFGIKPPLFDNRDIHVHVPEGATPKDGPSAGVAMATAIVSVMTGIPVRRDVAMTGEITLRGRVWPIAGLKEKLLAALRGGIKTVLIPEDNAKDLVEISESIKSGLEIVPVSRMDEVLARALTRKPEPIEWDETTTTAAAVPEEAPVEEEASTFTAHGTIYSPLKHDFRDQLFDEGIAEGIEVLLNHDERAEADNAACPPRRDDRIKVPPSRAKVRRRKIAVARGFQLLS